MIGNMRVRLNILYILFGFNISLYLFIVFIINSNRSATMTNACPQVRTSGKCGPHYNRSCNVHKL